MKYFILLCAAAVIFPSSAISDVADWDLYISQSKINKIVAKGDSLWCATDGGIMLFNLTDSVFTSYFDGLELRSSNIEAVVADENNNIWAGFRSHGIARIRDIDTDPKVNWYTEEYDLINDNVTCLAYVDDEIYYGTANGIGKFVEEMPSDEITLTDSLAGSYIYDILAVNDTILWVAGSKGVSRFNRITFDYSCFPIGFAFSLCSFNGNLYCATSNSIQMFEVDQWVPVGFPSGPDYPLISVASGGGELYCLTTERLYHWDSSLLTWQSVDAAGMSDFFYTEYRIWGGVNLCALEVDNLGNPWIGGFSIRMPGRGVNLCSYDGSEWITMNPGGLNSNIIRQVDMDPEGGVWVSTTHYGVCYNSGNNSWLSYVDSLSYSRYNIAIICDSEGRLWSSALEHPLDMVELGERLAAEDDQWERFSRIEDGISSRHQNIVEDPAGNLWFLSDDVDEMEGEWGIDIVNASLTEWISINPGNSDMPGGNVRDCVFDGSNVYLAINDYGVEVWHTGGFDWSALKDQSDDYWYTIVDGADLSSTVLNALEKSEGDLWVATAGGLVKRTENGDIIEYTSNIIGEERKILNNDIHDIEKDRFGNLWVATSGGLNIVDQGGTVKGIYTTYDYWKANLQIKYPNSVISPLPNADCKSLAFDRVNDKMWIGTINGLAGVDVTISSVRKRALSKLFLYPNPVYPSRGDTGLKISGISESVDVEVYNIEGELVHEKRNVSDGEQIWDILTINGFKAVSGVYIVSIRNSDSSELRKVAVVR